MEYSEFWQLVEEVFGSSFGKSMAQDQQLPALKNKTVVQALDDGVEPRIVWHALCEHMQIPDSQMWSDSHNAPPMPHH